MTTTESMTGQDLYDKLKKVNIKVGGSVCHYSLKKCEEFVPVINQINDIKKQKNAVILVHSYVSPEIIYGVGDYVGDSYALSKNALEVEADSIIFVAVRFMGETAKMLNPQKNVYITGSESGCTLADAINAEKVRELRKEYPDYTFVCYINTTAEVKAECDVCVTSGNVYHVVEKIPNDKIYFLPDKLMGINLAAEMKERGIKKDIKYFSGTCVVHEEYDREDIFRIQTEYPTVKIVSHPECKLSVCENSDYVGSTSQMIKYVRKTDADGFVILTECGLSERLQIEFPDKKIVGSCTLCKYMKSNTLENILRVLQQPTEQDRITIKESVRRRAAKCLNAMFQYSP